MLIATKDCWIEILSIGRAEYPFISCSLRVGMPDLLPESFLVNLTPVMLNSESVQQFCNDLGRMYQSTGTVIESGLSFEGGSTNGELTIRVNNSGLIEGDLSLIYLHHGIKGTLDCEFEELPQVEAHNLQRQFNQMLIAAKKKIA